MKYVLINSWCKVGSTGRIVYDFYKYLIQLGHQAYFFHGREEKQEDENIIRITGKSGIYIHAALARISGLQGYFSTLQTKRLINRINEIKPDYVYLFNLHGYYLNEPLLLDYLKRSGIKTVYMLFDEYPYLGKCCFSKSCMKFTDECNNCPMVKEYPKSEFFDKSKKLFKMKKNAYSGWDKLHFAGVKFIEERAKLSALAKNIPYHTFNMGVDLDNTYYYKSFDGIAAKYGIDTNKKIALNVGFSSDKRKGIDKYIEIARQSGEDWVFINIGYDKELSDDLPKNFIPIKYVADRNEMSKLYSMADLYVCTSSGEAMSNACIEALGCSTPIAAFDISGAPYLAPSPIGRYVVFDDIEMFSRIIRETGKKNAQIMEQCRSYALENYRDKDFMHNLYLASVEFDKVN